MKRIRCPGCDRALQYGEDKAGKKIKCPGCAHTFRVPVGRDAGPGGSEKAAAARAIRPEQPARQVEEVREGADDREKDPRCLECGGKADPTGDAYTFHGYMKRKDKGVEFGMVTSTIRYSYEGYQEETGLVCRDCVGAARRRLLLILLIVYGVVWTALFGVVVYHNAVKKISEGAYAAAITLIILSVVALVVLWVNDVATRDFAGQGLALKHNRERLLDNGLRVVGRGSLRSSYIR